MSTYQISPNQPARRANFDRRLRDQKLASIAETQVRTPATPHAANKAHFAMTMPNGHTLLSTPSTKLNDIEPIQVIKSQAEPKRQASRTTTLLGKYTMAQPVQAKLIKVKPGF